MRYRERNRWCIESPRVCIFKGKFTICTIFILTVTWCQDYPSISPFIVILNLHTHTTNFILDNGDITVGTRGIPIGFGIPVYTPSVIGTIKQFGVIPFIVVVNCNPNVSLLQGESLR